MDFISKLKSEKRQIEKVVCTAQARLAKLHPGKLRASSHGRGQYYLFDEKTGRWIYMSHRDLTRVKEAAQYDYEEKILRYADEQLKLIDRFIDKYNPYYIMTVQDKMKKARLTLLDLYLPTKEAYIKAWLSKPYTTNPCTKENGYLTQNGEFVRSKSEAIIANHLKFLGIYYRYEYPVKIEGNFVYPDFLLLDVDNRTEIVYEHFGRMDDRNYVNNNFMKKIARYARSGYYLGQNMIATFESSEKPLDIRDLDVVLKTVFPKLHTK